MSFPLGHEVEWYLENLRKHMSLGTNGRRHIGIRHRIKISREGEARPTKVAILQGGSIVEYELATEQDELDFVLDRFPVSWRSLGVDENSGAYPEHHRKQKKTEGGETILVPKAYDGLKEGDVVAVPLGGSGDCLSFALAKQGEKVGASLVRIPPFVLKHHRQNGEPVRFGEDSATQLAAKKNDDDHLLLAKLAKEKPSLFFPLRSADQDLILAREAWRALDEAMKARMAAALRLRQLSVGRIFTNPDGLYPEGGIEKSYDETKANDVILGALMTEEEKRSKELGKVLEKVAVYTKLFKPIEGMGPRIAARIISGIVDIRRFETDAQLKAFCGVYVLENGQFPRRRRGVVANWHPDVRQALVLFADQANRRPDSFWGKKLREIKKTLRQKHPAREKVEGKTGLVTRYSDGHIHKMSLWRLSTKFVEWLHKEWSALERQGELSKAA